MLYLIDGAFVAKPSRTASPALYTQAQIGDMQRQLREQEACSTFVMHGRVAREALELIKLRWPTIDRILIVCGNGSNTEKICQGLLLARLAAQSFYHVSVVMCDQTDLSEDAAKAMRLAEEQKGISWECISSERASDLFGQAELIVDALDVDEQSAGHLNIVETVLEINSADAPVLAFRAPHGLCADSGLASDFVVQANVTLTDMFLPQGLFMSAGLQYAGSVYLTDLGLDLSAFAATIASAQQNSVSFNSCAVSDRTPRRLDTHKSDFGHVLIVGGDQGYGGAAIIAAKAAARSGAGLVSFASRPEHLTAMLAQCPDVIAHAVASGQELEMLLEAPDVIVVGPGMKDSAWSDQMLRACLQSEKPLVVDAGALNLIAAQSVKYKQQNKEVIKREDWILLPHPGEAARLLNVSTSDIQKQRVKSVKQLQKKYGGVAVLKGAGTLHANADQTWLTPVANPALASAGMGDVLAGVVGSLLAQGESLTAAAAMGVNLHVQAAQVCSQTIAPAAVLTEDIIYSFRSLLS